MHACDAQGLAEADEQRRLAKLAADTPRLAMLMSASMVYVHSSGARDDRASYLDKLERGSLRYEAVEFTEPRFRLMGSVGAIHAGMQAVVLRNGIRHAAASHALAVWLHTGNGWQLEALHAAQRLDSYTVLRHKRSWN